MRINIIFLIYFFIISCNTNREKIQKPHFDETIVLNDLFLTIVNDSFNDTTDEIISTKLNKIVLLDSYLLLDNSISDKINALINERELDDIQINIVSDLLKHKQAGKIEVKRDDLVNTGQFIVIDSLSKDIKDEILGVLHLSTMSYDKTRNVGSFYYEFIYGNGYGNGSLVFFKWKNEKWEIYKDYLFWVS